MKDKDSIRLMQQTVDTAMGRDEDPGRCPEGTKKSPSLDDNGNPEWTEKIMEEE